MEQSGNGVGRGHRSVTILGSTGSIGQNTVDLIARNPESFEVVALTARRSVELLAQQARQLGIFVHENIRPDGDQRGQCRNVRYQEVVADVEAGADRLQLAQARQRVR